MYPIAGAGGLRGAVLVEAGQHGELGGDLPVSSSESKTRGIFRSASAMTAASCAPVAVSPGVEVGGPSHCESGRVGDLAARVAGDGQRESPYRGWLVQNGAERRAGGQRAVEDLFPAGVGP